jgi:rhodanese-related sulfurtransferase
MMAAASVVAVLSLGLTAVDAHRAHGATGSVPYQNLTPGQLKMMLQRKDFTLVNVHIPYEGEIQPTDAFVPYTEAAAKVPRLVPNRQAKIVVYCQTGRMSAIAADALVRLGYTRVFNLEGGMVAWKRAGYAVRIR